MTRVALSLAFVLALATSAAAQGLAPVDVLFRAMGVPDVIDIMRDEGLAYGEDLERDMFPDRGGVRWATQVSRIYNTRRMEETVRNRFDTELAAQDLAPMIAFFTSDLGKRIVQLEVAARSALLDPSVDEASRAALADLIDKGDPRLKLLRAFSDANELVDTNVVGAMNANYAFYTGLATGGALAGDLTEEDILADVWGQEAAIRADTEEWLFSYLALAYQPLTDAEIEAYTDFSRTEPGTTLNRALFAAFDEMFVAVSLALGQAASQYMLSQDL